MRVELAASALAAVVGLLSRSFRYRLVDGEAHREAALAAGAPLVVSFWHDRSLLASGFLLRHLHRRGLPLTMLASHSRDGELVAGVGRRFGLPVVRGSASRGGREALVGTYLALKRHRSSPILIPDGPRGPRHEAKTGVVALAQLAAAPVLPLGFATRRFRTLRSWDRLIVPPPFAAVTVVVGEPLAVPRRLDSAQLEAARADLEARLAAATAAAERAAGALPEVGPVPRGAGCPLPPAIGASRKEGVDRCGRKPVGGQ